jgi:hypothetical protein
VRDCVLSAELGGVSLDSDAITTPTDLLNCLEEPDEESLLCLLRRQSEESNRFYTPDLTVLALPNLSTTRPAASKTAVSPSFRYETFSGFDFTPQAAGLAARPSNQSATAPLSQSIQLMGDFVCRYGEELHLTPSFWLEYQATRNQLER